MSRKLFQVALLGQPCDDLSIRGYSGGGSSLKDTVSGESFSPNKKGRSLFATSTQVKHFIAGRHAGGLRTAFKSKHNGDAPHGKRRAVVDLRPTIRVAHT